MSKVSELRKEIIERICGTFFCEPDEDTYPTYWDMFEQLKKEYDNGESFTDVPLWDGCSDMTVINLYEAIDGQADMVESLMKQFAVPKFLQNMDWNLLREQKESLNVAVNYVDGGSKLQAHLEGIVNTLDAIQDYSCDVMGKDENDVFNLED